MAILILALASSLNFMFDLGAASAMVNATYYAFTMVAAALLAVAALMILQWRRAMAVPFVMLVIGLVYAFSIAILGLSLSFGMVVGPVTLILNIVPILLFGHLARTTRRITAVALMFLVLSYIIYPIASVSTDPSVIAAILGIRLLGPALASIAFLKPELGVSIELFGYALSINVVTFWFSYSLAFGITDVIAFISVGVISLVAVVGFATSTYTFTRFRESRNSATATLAVYFMVGSVSYIIVALTSIGALTGPTNAYTSASLGFLAMMFINLSAFIALDWRIILLLPLVIVAPGLIYMFMWYPTELATIPGYEMVIGITNMIQNLVPLGLYFFLWSRMRKTGTPGRSRPLFLALGLVLLIVGSLIGVTAEGTITIVGILPGSVLLMSYVVFWTGITGRADVLLNTV